MYPSIFSPYPHGITKSTKTPREKIGEKLANNLSETLSGHAAPKDTKTPAELKQMKAPRSFSKQKTMEGLLKKYEGNSDYVIIYGYYQEFPKYAFKKPFIDEWTLLVESANQQEELKNAMKPVKYARTELPADRKLYADLDSPYITFDRGRKVPRKPNLDQLDDNRN